MTREEADRILDGKIEKRMDEIFDEIDDLLTAGEFQRVDEILDEVNTETGTLDAILSYLTITFAAGDRLTRRAGFFDRVKARFLKDEPDEAESTLKGLEPQ